MKESLKKFREEAEKLEQSEALRTARQKFHTVESEANKGSEAIKEKLDTLKEKVYMHIRFICDSVLQVFDLYSIVLYNSISLYSKGARSYRGGK